MVNPIKGEVDMSHLLELGKELGGILRIQHLLPERGLREQDHKSTTLRRLLAAVAV
jgi:hypothetical protein